MNHKPLPGDGSGSRLISASCYREDRWVCFFNTPVSSPACTPIFRGTSYLQFLGLSSSVLQKQLAWPASTPILPTGHCFLACYCFPACNILWLLSPVFLVLLELGLYLSPYCHSCGASRGRSHHGCPIHDVESELTHDIFQL